MMKLILSGLLPALAIAGFGYNSQAQDLTWVGCGITKKAFMGALAEAYEKKTGVKIGLAGGGATKGIRDVSDQAADIGGSCRHKLTGVPEEADVKLTPVAWDAIVVITHRSNPVKNITLDDLESVFSGEILNWQELGGLNAPIDLVAREGKTSGVGRMVRELVFSDPEMDFPPHTMRLRSSGPVEKHVETHETALAFTGVSSARKRNVGFMGINGVLPTYENISSGTYPLYRPLYLTSRKDSPQTVNDFIRFALKPEGQAIVKAQGTVTLRDGGKLWAEYRKKMNAARQIGNF